MNICSQPGCLMTSSSVINIGLVGYFFSAGISFLCERVFVSVHTSSISLFLTIAARSAGRSAIPPGNSGRASASTHLYSFLSTPWSKIDRNAGTTHAMRAGYDVIETMSFFLNCPLFVAI